MNLVKKPVLNTFLVCLLTFSMLAAPMAAEAGILSSILRAVRPMAGIAGNIAGAVAGVTLGSAFVPPLGMLIGGVAGWIVGGIIANHGSASLANLATIGGAVVGGMALASMGPIGYVIGGLAGGWLGRTAMNLLQGADRRHTGGVLFMTGEGTSVSAPTGISSSGPVTFSGGEIPATFNQAPAQAPAPVTDQTVQIQVQDFTPSTEEIREADAEYRAAYQEYLRVSREGNAEKIRSAYSRYNEAIETYRNLTGDEPK